MKIAIVLLQLVAICLLVTLWRRPAVSRVLVCALAVSFASYYLLPVIALTFIVTDGDFLFVPTELYVHTAVVELAVFAATCSALLVARPFLASVRNAQLCRREVRPSLLCTVLSVGIVLPWIVAALSIVLPWMVGSPSAGMSYLERNDALLADAQTSIPALIQFVLLSVAYAALVFYRGSHATLVQTLAVLLVAVVNVPYFLRGGRIALLVPLTLILFRAANFRWTKQWFLIVAVSAAAMIISVTSFTYEALNQMRVSDYDFSPMELLDRSRNRGTGLSESFSQKIAEGIISKFDTISYSAQLLAADGPAFAGLQPYAGAILALVPRQLYPDKPVSGSADGTLLGHPTRRSAILLGATSTSYNVQVSPAAVSRWQLGYPGILLVVVFGGVNLWLINSFMLSHSVFAEAIALALVGLPACYDVFASPDVLIMNWSRIPVLYVTWRLLTSLAGPRPPHRGLFPCVQWRDGHVERVSE